MLTLQEECNRLRSAAQNGDIDDIKLLALSGVDVINADVSLSGRVSKCYMLQLYWGITYNYITTGDHEITQCLTWVKGTAEDKCQ